MMGSLRSWSSPQEYSCLRVRSLKSIPLGLVLVSTLEETAPEFRKGLSGRRKRGGPEGLKDSQADRVLCGHSSTQLPSNSCLLIGMGHGSFLCPAASLLSVPLPQMFVPLPWLSVLHLWMAVPPHSLNLAALPRGFQKLLFFSNLSRI